jgi:hypothetical protein
MVEIKKHGTYLVTDPDGLGETPVKVLEFDEHEAKVKFLKCVWNLNTNSMVRRKGEKVILPISRLK